MICPICKREVVNAGKCRNCENVIPMHSGLPSISQWLDSFPRINGEAAPVKDARIENYVGKLTNKMLEVEILTEELAQRTKTLERLSDNLENKIQEMDALVQKVLADSE
tara:strand:+ start:155 stop:481 length:327 start_codon:yes stop_codon:yes gene_type:complete